MNMVYCVNYASDLLWLSLFIGFQLFFSGLDTIQSLCETKVRDFLVSEDAFFKNDFQMIQSESVKHMFVMGVRLNQTGNSLFLYNAKLS
jgi:hypothetical protein